MSANNNLLSASQYEKQTNKKTFVTFNVNRRPVEQSECGFHSNWETFKEPVYWASVWRSYNFPIQIVSVKSPISLTLYVIEKNTKKSHSLKVPDMIHNIIPHFFQTVILVPKVQSQFSEFCGEIWCEYSKYFRRNQWKRCLEIRKRGHHTK